MRDLVLFSYLIVIFAGHFAAANSADDFDHYSAQSSLFWQLNTIVVFCVGFYSMYCTPRAWSEIIKALKPMLPLLFWILLSITWSDFPDLSMRRAVRFLMEVIALVCFAAAYPDPYRILRIIFLSFAIVVLLDVVLLAFPKISYMSIGYAGIHGHKNEAGQFSFLALPVFLLAIFDRRIFSIRSVALVLTASCLVILVLSSSKTALTLTFVCFFVTFAIVLLFQLPAAGIVAAIVIGLLGSAIALVFVVNIGISTFLDNILAYIYNDTSLTGRDRVWEYVLYRFSQSPLVGHGYGALWRDPDSYVQQRNFGNFFMAGQAHNGYLDILAQIGIIGLILTALFLLATFCRSVLLLAGARKPITFIAIYTTIGIITYNFTESSLASSGKEMWLYFILVVSNALMTRGLCRGELPYVRSAAHGPLPHPESRATSSPQSPAV